MASKILKPTRLDLDPSSPSAAKEWKHWLKTFNNFLAECGEHPPDKLRSLVNLMSHNVYDYIEDCTTYLAAEAVLTKLYVRTPNEIFARHLLATRKQAGGESIDEFLQVLKRLVKDCNVKAVTRDEHTNLLLRDSFINGLTSSDIRQRLLEKSDPMTLDGAYDLAKSLDRAQDAQAYSPASLAALPIPTNAAAASVPYDEDVPSMAATYHKSKKCFFCGGSLHNRRSCPARDSFCRKCSKKGHYATVCLSQASSNSSSTSPTTATLFTPTMCAINTSPASLAHATIPVTINGKVLSALVDSCSSNSFISSDAVSFLGLATRPSSQKVNMAISNLNSEVRECCDVDMELNQRTYRATRLGVMDNLCSDLILGFDFQKVHKRLTFDLGGPTSELNVPGTIVNPCAVSVALVDEPSLFANVSPNIKPIATSSRRYHPDDREFIQKEVDQLLADGVVEPSTSPWRAQVVVVKQPEKGKKRLCVDYSQTINIHTEADSYPLPRIDDMINNLAKYTVFSTFDLKQAYHQIPIKPSDKKYTGFEANGKLYQFCRIPFGVTNGVAVFQRQMDKLIAEEGLVDTFPYLDDITIGGRTQEEHDANVQAFVDVAKRRHLTLNEAKSVISVTSIKVLGYLLDHGQIRPDPDRLRPLQEFPPPTSQPSLRRALGMFAYYAKWIPNFSNKIQPLINTTTFPLNPTALNAFRLVKKELETATLQAIDESLPFVVECDASEVAVSATLNQGGRPVAVMSRTLQISELCYPAVGKEATAVIEAVCKWSHLLYSDN